MLVLSREHDQEVVLIVPPSSEPTIVRTIVVDIRGNRVRLGFDAPREVVIHRKEVFLAIERQKLAATNGGDGAIAGLPASPQSPVPSP